MLWGAGKAKNSYLFYSLWHKMSSSSHSSDDNSVRIRDHSNASETTSEQAAESIKNVAMGIHSSI